MRETLGLSGRGRAQSRSQPSTTTKQRHRFVQDGEVPVIHMNGLRDGDAAAASRGRITTLEAAVETEHALRIKAEQAVQAGLAHIHALETKLAHVEMSAREAVATERQARARAEAELQVAAAARDVAPPPITALPEDAPRPVKPRVKRALQAKMPRVKEPQPVKWWLGSARSKTV